MKPKTYYHGDGIHQYGIYNAMQKTFQFGISEPSPYLAEQALFKKIGHNAKKWRFEARQLPTTPRKPQGRNEGCKN